MASGMLSPKDSNDLAHMDCMRPRPGNLGKFLQDTACKRSRPLQRQTILAGTRMPANFPMTRMIRKEQIGMQRSTWHRAHLRMCLQGRAVEHLNLSGNRNRSCKRCNL